MRPTSQHDYQIAPELRRCCWYVILGAVALTIVFFLIARFVQNRGGADVALGCVLFAILAAAMILPLRWKLRLDENGVSRRLFRWDLWSWSDLQSGRIRKIYPYTLYDPERPWWRRRMRLGYMEANDIQEVISTVNTRYTLPLPPDVPDTLTIKYGFRRKVTFDHKGIHLTVCDRPYEYLWRDLREIHLTRMDPARRDFKSLLITLPNQELELKLVTHQGGTSPTWRGATAEEINEYLVQFVPTDRIHTSIAGQQLTKREHIERKLQEAKKRTREFAVITLVFLPLIVGLLVWMAIDDGILKAIVMGAMFAVFPGSVIFFVYRSHRKQISDLIDSLKKADSCVQHCHRTNR